MKFTQVTCENCNKTFNKPTNEYNRSIRKKRNQYCSRNCASVARQGPQVFYKPNVMCAFCSKPFYKKPSSISGSKSGLFFCCRNHKDQAQRIGGIEEIMPSHYGTGLNIDCKAYRKIASKHHKLECVECGFNEVPEILHVHHIDQNRSNNLPANLEWRCGRCHDLIHFRNKTGKWKT